MGNMTKQEAKLWAERHRFKVSQAKSIEPKYMMGTKAYHFLGDISRDEPGLFRAQGETEDSWLGSWVTGYGFMSVLFPKETSRELTKEEVEKYNKTFIQIGSQPPIKLKVD
jgi:hypothetical protein